MSLIDSMELRAESKSPALTEARSGAHLLDRICQLNQTLSSGGLTPAEIGAALTELSTLTRHRQGEDLSHILADERLCTIQAGLHATYAANEYALEEYWSKRVSAAADPRRELLEFPFYEHYRQAANLEYHLLAAVGRTRIRRMVFAGSGPMPLSSIMMAREFGLPARNIDFSSRACELGAQLVHRLGVEGIEFECRDVVECGGFEPTDAVVLAAHIGGDRAQKIRVIESLHRQAPPGTLLLARSTEGLRTIVYPKLEVHDVIGFTPIAVVHPLTEAENSIIIARNEA